MSFLPVVERELRVAARRRAAYWWRLGASLAALAVMAWLAWVAPETFLSPQRSGRPLFTVLAVLTFVLCLGIGGALTADCLSSEKREGTLGLLFLTDLRGYDVVLGKLAACALGAFYALLAVLPVLALSLLLGGVPTMALVSTAVLLLNTLFFSLTAGLFMSAVSRDERRALGATTGLILGIAFGLPLLGLGAEEFTRWPRQWDIGELLALPSPAYGLMQALDKLINAPVPGGVGGQFWFSQLWVHALGWLFLLLACAILPRTWHETGTNGDTTSGWRAAWHRWWFGNAGVRRGLRARLLELNPVTWLTNRHRARTFGAWASLGGLTALWLSGLLLLGADWDTAFVAVLFALLAHSLFKIQVATEACRRFAEDRRSGALELLLSTPQTTAEIVKGQWLALRRTFFGPLLALAVLDMVWLLSARRDAGEGILELAMVFGVGLAVTALDFVALAWLGMWQGLRARSYSIALGVTLAVILAIPWVVWIVGAVTLLALGLLEDVVDSSESMFLLLLGSWALISVVVGVAAIVHARARLATRFHSEATGLGAGKSR